jgi:hypothetical protein
MHVEQLPSVGEVMSALEAQRQRLSDADLVGASRSALASARDALPEGWGHRRQASRWPWFAGAILGVTFLGLLVLTPSFLRWRVSRRVPDVEGGVTGDATPEPATADATIDQAGPAEPHDRTPAPLIDEPVR